MDLDLAKVIPSYLVICSVSEKPPCRAPTKQQAYPSQPKYLKSVSQMLKNYKKLKKKIMNFWLSRIKSKGLS